MRQWGVYESADELPQVMPCDAEGFVIGGHLASRFCWCQPTISHNARQDGQRVSVLVHHEEEKGDDTEAVRAS